MPSLGWAAIPNYLRHVLQSGHKECEVFAEESDFGYHLNALAKFKQEYDVKVYAFSLMTNNVPLLLEPMK